MHRFRQYFLIFIHGVPKDILYVLVKSYLFVIYYILLYALSKYSLSVKFLTTHFVKKLFKCLIHLCILKIKEENEESKSVYFVIDIEFEIEYCFF